MEKHYAVILHGHVVECTVIREWAVRRAKELGGTVYTCEW